MNRSPDIFKIFLSLGILLISLNLMAQQPVLVHFPDSSGLPHTTATSNCCNDMLLYQLRKDPGFKAKEEKMNREILNAIYKISTDTIITLPVVVHIINENPNSITDLQVINGINDLNDAFSKSGNYSASLGVDTKLRFCLAHKDPDGGNTTGITRTKSFFSSDMNKEIEDARLKNLIQWNPAKYINIWLITNIKGWVYEYFSCGNWYRSPIGGYATLPRVEVH
jgi:hypothetical protein